MKNLKLLMAALIMIAWVPLAAQNKTENKHNDDVPAHVQTKFSHEFPQTQDTEWKLVDDSYVVEFTTAGGENQKVWYDKAGEKQAEERKLNMEKGLPTAVKKTIDNQFGSYDIKDVVQVNKEGSTSYRVELNKNGSMSEVMLNADGMVIKE